MLTTFIFMETEPREQCDELPCTYFVKFDLEPQYDGYWLILLYSMGTGSTVWEQLLRSFFFVITMLTDT